jgi:hypothetical protein
VSVARGRAYGDAYTAGTAGSGSGGLENSVAGVACVVVTDICFLGTGGFAWAHSRTVTSLFVHA